jgi:transcriptional regulator with XRE-family HTH domain
MPTVSSVFGDAPSKRPVNDTPLEAWLKMKGVSRYELAKRLGVTPRTVGLWANNQVLPDLVNAFRLQQATEGGVSPENWCGTDLFKFMWTHSNADWEESKKQKRKSNRREYIKRKKGQAHE